MGYYVHRAKYIQEHIEGKVLDVGYGEGFPYHGSKRKPDVTLDLPWNKNVMVHGDAHYLPFRDKSFDTVNCADILEHIKNPCKCIEEALRVGRKLVATVPSNRDHKGKYPVYCIPDTETLKEWLSGYDHDIEEIETRRWRGYGIVAHSGLHEE